MIPRATQVAAVAKRALLGFVEDRGPGMGASLAALPLIVSLVISAGMAAFNAWWSW